MQHIFSSTLPIFLITLLGSIIKRNWISSEEFWRGLEKLSYFLLFPCVLFNYISIADLRADSLIKLVVALIISTSIIAIILVIHRKTTESDAVAFTSTFQGAIRYNSYIFFGLSSALFGTEGLEIVAVISSYMIVFTNILAVGAFVIYIPDNAGTGNTKSIMLSIKLIALNPLIMASIAGFIFNYFDWSIHLGVSNTISSLSNSALAIGMLNVGAGLKFIVSKEYVRQIFYTGFFKLIALPVVTVIILSIMSITGLEKSVGILYSCLPCASTAYVLSRQLGGDPESMAAIITFTTIFSLVTLSMLMYILS
jgi:malonate transporter and related proteins